MLPFYLNGVASRKRKARPPLATSPFSLVGLVLPWVAKR